MALVNHSYKDFMFESRLNFAHWKLVDLDNYMHGNKPFTQLDDENPVEKWQAKVDRLAPDVDFLDNTIDEIEGDDEEVNKTWEYLNEFTRLSLQRLAAAEPNSNWNLGLE